MPDIKFDFTDKVVIVTGARTGIGLEAATEFAQAGAHVVLAGHHEPSKEAQALREQGLSYDRVVDTDLKGVFLCMKHELAAMKKGGKIVNCSSMGGVIGLSGRAAYHAAKHGVIGMTKSVGLEYASRGINVNAVCPGVIHTPMVDRMMGSEKAVMDSYVESIPAKRMAEPREIAQVVLFLCSSAASYLVGEHVVIDGGYTIQ